MVKAKTHFGVHVGPQMCTMQELRDTWVTAEKLGFDWISVWDHFYPAPAPLDGDCFEAVACHAALATVTERARVGCLVYSAGYRHPAVLANAAVTIDHLSNGRLELGIGAGWHMWEYNGYGIPFESPAVRLRRMKEAVEVVRLLFTEDEADYKGEFFTLDKARCNPKPVQRPPRIWVGASGEQIGLKLAGRHGDGWNVPFISPEEFARKREIVLANAPKPDDLETAVNVAYIPAEPDRVDEEIRVRFGPLARDIKSGAVYGNTAMVTEKVGQYIEAGAKWVILALRAPFDIEAIQRFAEEVVPSFS